MSESAEIAIVGAGAAGLAAAIFAAERAPRGTRIALLEGAAKVGAKILIAGGGRCNVTHDVVRPEDFNGARNPVRNILAGFRQEETVEWFESLGVRLKREDTGKLFPVTDRASTVLDALLRRCADLGVEILVGHRVASVKCDDDGFLVEHARGALRAARVVLATGGRSLPRTGSDGGGWAIARSLRHTVGETHQALVPLVLERCFHADLSGLSLDVELSVFADRKLIDRRRGSMLWTHFGVSGPVVLDASRQWVVAEARGQRPELRCSFRPGCSFEEMERELIDAAGSRARASLRRILGAELPERLIDQLAAAAGLDATQPVAQLTREDRRALVRHLVEFVLPVASPRGWDFAEVTAGGVPLAEIDFRTMQSRVVPGLYLVGEMLDCDGRIGGFNFQWAWATGRLAGRAVGAR